MRAKKHGNSAWDVVLHKPPWKGNSEGMGLKMKKPSLGGYGHLLELHVRNRACALLHNKK